MILDIRARPADAHLYEVLDAQTGEPIAEPIFYANDERGFYRRYVRDSSGRYLPDDDSDCRSYEEVRRPIRIAPRLERLCASLRASLAEQGVSADEIPEPVLGALALSQERLQRLERRVQEAIAHPQQTVAPPGPRRYTPRSEEEIRRIAGASSPPVNSAEWLESVTREPMPMTRADLERSFPSLRLETCTTAERMGNPDGRYPVCMPRIGEADVCERCGGPVDLAINRPCPAVPREQRWGPSVESVTTPDSLTQIDWSRVKVD